MKIDYTWEFFFAIDDPREARQMKTSHRDPGCGGFTLIELLVVISIVAVLAGLLFSIVPAVMNQARKTQAKNDLAQIVTAVNAYYTEYGKYPTSSTVDITFSASNNTLFDILRNMTGTTPGNTSNARGISFLNVPLAADQTNSKSGIKRATGVWYDPWGSSYNVAIDGNYNNIVRAPAYTDLLTTYTTATDSSGDVGMGQGVIAWSFGKNGALGGGTAASTSFSNESGTAGKYQSSGDVISWQ